MYAWIGVENVAGIYTSINHSPIVHPVTLHRFLSSHKASHAVELLLERQNLVVSRASTQIEENPYA